VDEVTRGFYNGLGCAESEVPTIFCGGARTVETKKQGRSQRRGPTETET
jgi:hypothetical protein